MTRTELLDAAAEKLIEAAKLLDRADEDRSRTTQSNSLSE